jgi:hypothetical protein
MARLNGNEVTIGDLKAGDTIMRYGQPWRRVVAVHADYANHVCVLFRYVRSNGVAQGNVIRWYTSTDRIAAEG